MLMQMLMTIAILINIHAALELIVSTIFSDHLKKLLESYPNLSCSLLSKHGFELAGMVTFCIIGFKIFLTTHPMDYLEMNHERIMIIILCSIVILEIVDWCIILKFSGTFCVKQKVVELNSIYQIKVEKENFKVSLPVGAFLGLLLLIQETVYISVKMWKRIKCRQTRKVVPIISFKCHPVKTKTNDNCDKTENLDDTEHVSLDIDYEEEQQPNVIKCKPQDLNIKPNQSDFTDKVIDIEMNRSQGTSTGKVSTVLETVEGCDQNITFDQNKEISEVTTEDQDFNYQESSNSIGVKTNIGQNKDSKDNAITISKEAPQDKYIDKQYTRNSRGKGKCVTYIFINMILPFNIKFSATLP